MQPSIARFSSTLLTKAGARTCGSERAIDLAQSFFAVILDKVARLSYICRLQKSWSWPIREFQLEDWLKVIAPQSFAI